MVPFARGCRLATCRATLARECCLLSGILHSLRPVHDLRTVSHLDDRFRGDQIEIVHLVTVWAQDHQVADSVVCAVAVDVGDFENGGDTESAMRTERVIRVEGDLPVVDSLCHLLSPSQRQGSVATHGCTVYLRSGEKPSHSDNLWVVDWNPLFDAFIFLFPGLRPRPPIWGLEGSRAPLA